MRKVASRFNIIQIGLAVFHEKPPADGAPSGSKAYEAHVFNFYVFPETGPVNMEAGGVHFNSNNGMDWNTWIKEGIPYVQREAAQKLRETMLPAAPAQEKEKEVANK